MKNKNLIFSVIAFVIFTCLLFFYFSPLLTGKQILQHDITQFKGAYQEVKKYKEQTGEETYWSNSMFSGMPTYQNGAHYPNDFLLKIDEQILRAFPSPLDYVWLLFAGFFFLIIVWLKDWKYALLGAVMFSFSTYFFIIIDAGHNAKVHTIAYFAPFVAGVFLLFERKYFWGFFVTTLFLGLQLAANHPQMTYYLFLAMMFFAVIQIYNTIKTKQYKPFFISSSLLILAFLLAFGMNATRYLATYQYQKETTRGKSEISVGKSQGNDKTEALDRSYITQWSYGKLETFNLFIPNFFGGGNNEKAFKSDNFEAEIQSMMQNGSIRSEEQFQKIVTAFRGSYWGEQPMTSGPAYQGAIVIFLAILSLFFYKSNYKYWLISATILSIWLAWGKNMNILTNFFIDYFPFYNKFRAVSSLLVIAEFTIPLLAVLGLYSFYNDEKLSENYKKKILLYVGGSTLFLLLIFYFFGGNLFDFHSQAEGDVMPENLLKVLKFDRLVLFKSDVLRTLLFVTIALAILFASLYKKINATIAILILSFFSLLDLWNVNNRYLNDDKFVSAKIVKYPFPTDSIQDTQGNPTIEQISAQAPINKILNEIAEKDKSTYRVFNVALGFDENTTSYFHQNIGGYHAAKLRRYQDLIDIHLSSEPNMEVLNMLNAKYVVFGNPKQPQVSINPDANGNAWFVQNIEVTHNPNDEILTLKKINTKKTAIVDTKDKSYIDKNKLAKDSTAFLRLENYKPNHLTYKSQSAVNQLAVFSEIYYPYGWKAFVDGKENDYIRADYTLRAMAIPKGIHTIEFKFQPEVITKGSTISLIAFIAFLLISIGFYFFQRKSFLKNINP